MIVNGIEYHDATLELHPDGSVHDATLTRDTVIRGLPCAGGRAVVIYPSGRVRLAWLAARVVLNGIPCAAGVVTYFHQNGAVLSASLADEYRGLPAGTRATFGEGGELLEYSQRLERDAVISGLPCSSAFHVWRYAGDRLSRVVLAAPATVGGREYPRGAELQFDEAGRVVGRTDVDLDSGRRYHQRVFGVYEAPFA